MPLLQGADAVAALVLQNPGTTALAARRISFGQGFGQGEMPAERQLIAEIGGSKVAVQMDVISTYADGSVRMSVLTMQQPALAAGVSAPVVLRSTAASTGVENVDLAKLLSEGYAVSVDLSVQQDGAAKAYSFDAAALLRQAMDAGKVSYWLRGPEVTEGRVDVPVTGSLHLTFDIRRYADGTTRTDVQFNNDLAMKDQGGRVQYDATIRQNGIVAFQQSGIDQYQYQTWRKELWSNGEPGVNVQQNVTALAKAGFIPNYDFSTGVKSSLITDETSRLSGSNFAVLGSGDITTYFPGTGGRADIGPQPMWNNLWLTSQDANAAKYALAQADASGSVPWHFSDGDNTYVTATEHPQLWVDYRGGNWGTEALTQSPNVPGWDLDTSHQPDMSYVPYLMTGNRYYLDQMNAQGSYNVLSYDPGGRMADQGITNAWQQTRARAWGLRQYIEAAATNPDGSQMGNYFKQVVTNNIQQIITDLKEQAPRVGELAGYNAADDTLTSPWMDDFLTIVLGQAAGMGFAGAKEALALKTNFVAGRFLAADQGFNPLDAANYRIAVSSESKVPYTTWAQAWEGNKAAGLVYSDGGSWYQSEAYTRGALAANASIFTYTGSPDALKAYGYILSAMPTNYGTESVQRDPIFNIVPRLSDGALLTADQVQITRDTVGGDLTAAGPDRLLYETGSADMTLRSGGGVGILFAGSGNTRLVGTAGQDYLFGGSGNDVFEAGAGANFMDGGKGADLFALSWQDIAQDVIAGFMPGIDRLKLTGTAPNGAGIDSVIRTATTDATGNGVLHLGNDHNVTLQGVGVNQLSQGLFA